MKISSFSIVMRPSSMFQGHQEIHIRIIDTNAKEHNLVECRAENDFEDLFSYLIKKAAYVMRELVEKEKA